MLRREEREEEIVNEGEGEYLYEDPTSMMDSIQGNVEQTPVFEPRLSTLDEWAKKTFFETLHEMRWVNTNEGLKLLPVKLIYPRIMVAGIYAYSHLNMVVNYNWHMGKAEVLKWEGYQRDPLLNRHCRDNFALSLIDHLDQVINRAVNGGSTDGSTQTYNWKIMGGLRQFAQGMSGREEKRR